MDNIPAFPSNISNSLDNLTLGIHQGMTLRDYFAGQALSGFDHHNTGDFPVLARICYEIADAMLKAREEVK